MAQTEEQTAVSVGERTMRFITGARLLGPLVVLGLGMLLTILLAIALAIGAWDGQALIQMLLLASLTSLLAFVLSLQRLRRELIFPLARLEESVSQVCAGEPGATLSLDDTGVLELGGCSCLAQELLYVLGSELTLSRNLHCHRAIEPLISGLPDGAEGAGP